MAYKGEVLGSGGRRSGLSKRLDAVGWGLFFIWIGVVFLVRDIPDGVDSMGIGAIVLFGSLVRLILGVSVSFFWVVIGLIFLMAGVGEYLAIDLPLFPLALIICGVLLFLHRSSAKHGGRG